MSKISKKWFNAEDRDVKYDSINGHYLQLYDVKTGDFCPGVMLSKYRTMAVVVNGEELSFYYFAMHADDNAVFEFEAPDKVATDYIFDMLGSYASSPYEQAVKGRRALVEHLDKGVYRRIYKGDDTYNRCLFNHLEDLFEEQWFGMDFVGIADYQWGERYLCTNPVVTRKDNGYDIKLCLCVTEAIDDGGVCASN